MKLLWKSLYDCKDAIMLLFIAEDGEAYKKKKSISGICFCQHPESTWNVFN